MTLSLVGGKTIKAPFIHMSEIQVGNAVVNDLIIGVSTTGFNQSKIDWLLGSDFLKFFTVTIDHENSQLKLAPQKKYMGEGIVPMDVVKD